MVKTSFTMDGINGDLIQAPNDNLITAIQNYQVDPLIYVEWLLLFGKYNEEHGTKLKFLCRPCFYKVYNWYKIKLYQEKFRED